MLDPPSSLHPFLWRLCSQVLHLLEAVLCRGYNEEEFRRDACASFPCILELTRLQGNYARLWVGTEKPDETRDVTVTLLGPHTIVIRALSHLLGSSSLTDDERRLIYAMDKLDRTLLNPLVTGQQAGRKKIKTRYQSRMVPSPPAFSFSSWTSTRLTPSR